MKLAWHLPTLAALVCAWGCNAPQSDFQGTQGSSAATKSKPGPETAIAPGELDTIEAEATPVTFTPDGAAPATLAKGTPETYEDLFDAERVASEVYAVMAEKWGGRPFTKIMEAEQTHMAAVSGILERRGSRTPGTEAGKYKKEEFQALYDAMVERGSKSRNDAMDVGAELEEMSIRDLLVWRESEKDEVVKKVLDNLVRGSSNHLRAFLRGRKALGMKEYETKYLPKAELKKYAGETK